MKVQNHHPKGNHGAPLNHIVELKLLQSSQHVSQKLSIVHLRPLVSRMPSQVGDATVNLMFPDATVNIGSFHIQYAAVCS